MRRLILSACVALFAVACTKCTKKKADLEAETKAQVRTCPVVNKTMRQVEIVDISINQSLGSVLPQGKRFVRGAFVVKRDGDTVTAKCANEMLLHVVERGGKLAVVEGVEEEE